MVGSPGLFFGEILNLENYFLGQPLCCGLKKNNGVHPPWMAGTLGSSIEKLKCMAQS